MIAPGVERVMGIEPTFAAWEAAVLPLDDTRVGKSVAALARLPQAVPQPVSQSARDAVAVMP